MSVYVRVLGVYQEFVMEVDDDDDEVFELYFDVDEL